MFSESIVLPESTVALACETEFWLLLSEAPGSIIIVISSSCEKIVVSIATNSNRVKFETKAQFPLRRYSKLVYYTGLTLVIFSMCFGKIEKN